ncbi:MAG: GNAT family N-acetyltransferase [Acidimicrobiales bacterium]
MKRAAFISRVETDSEFADLGVLIREYVASLPFTLDFQDFEGELAELREIFAPPGGAAFLAYDDLAPVGCVGVRRWSDGVAELKRMYVRPQGRGRGLGRGLCVASISAARDLGYSSIRLDTVAELTVAGEIYTSLGFVLIPPYRENPLASARYYELRLEPDEDEKVN